MKSMKKTSVILMAVVLSLLLVLSGCSSNSQSSNAAANSQNSSNSTSSTNNQKKTKTKTASAKKVTINFWSFWGSKTRRPVIQKIVDNFNKSQDKIQVKYTYLPWGDIWTKNLAAIAAGDPPDVIINDIRSVAVRAKNNQNTDLAPLIKKDSSFNKDVYFQNLWKDVLYNGDPYALPFNTDTRVLYYNKDQFKAAGLDPNKPPQTWDELLADAKKLDKKVNGKYVRIGFNPNFCFGTSNWMMDASNGQSYFDADGKPHVNTQANIDTLNWMNSWTKRLGGRKQMDAFKAAFGSKTADPFISGKLSMFINTATYYTQIKQYGKNMNVGYTTIPSYKPGMKHVSSGGGFVAEIPKGSKHEQAAYEFLKYLTGKDAQAYWGKTLYDNIANKVASNAPELQAVPIYKFAVENMKNTVVTTVPTTAPDYNSVISPEMDKALLGKISAKDALDKAQKDVENMIKRNSGK